MNNNDEKDSKEVQFHIGQVIHHKLFDYRGVVIDVDFEYSGSSEWYDAVARSRPPKEKPWYHILPDGTNHKTYVAERNLKTDETGKPIKHPEIGVYFSGFKNGSYITNKGLN